MYDIGSEYWLEHNVQNSENTIFEEISNNDFNYRLFFLGRSAIHYVIEDIQKDAGIIETVYMPSYCCDSMLQPFRNKEVKVEFYNVYFDNNGIKYDIDLSTKCDIFLAISYFGFGQSHMDETIIEFKKKNIFVVEDITHRFLSGKSMLSKADYYIASLRKWFPIPSGGVAIKRDKKFQEKQILPPPPILIEKKLLAMRKKRNYINNYNQTQLDKNLLRHEFNALYSYFNKTINDSFENFKIDLFSEKILKTINIEEVKFKRRRNANYIYNNLEESQYIRFLFKSPQFEDDCPLFVPIIVSPEIRNSLQNFLASRNIFCPIHWPVPLEHMSKQKKNNSLYLQEFSLICDQRYELEDMSRMIKVIKEFIEQL